MTIKLNIAERLFSLTMLNAYKGSLDKLSVILEDIKKFPITKEEWKTAEKKEVKTSDGGMNWTWNDEKGGIKDIEVNKITVDYLTEEIKKKDDAGEFTLADRNVITLKGKLK